MPKGMANMKSDKKAQIEWEQKESMYVCMSMNMNMNIHMNMYEWWYTQ